MGTLQVQWPEVNEVGSDGRRYQTLNLWPSAHMFASTHMRTTHIGKHAQNEQTWFELVELEIQHRESSDGATVSTERSTAFLEREARSDVKTPSAFSSGTTVEGTIRGSSSSPL